MARYGMIIDVTRCNGCYNCFLACKDEFSGNDFLPYSLSQPDTGHYWIKIIEKERGVYPKVKVSYIPIPCMQCEDPPCVKGSLDGEIYKRSDGIVIIDPEKSVGKKDLISTCPYRVIYWNEERRIPQKCTFCAHLLDKGWKKPRCVEVCPSDALIFGDLDDPESKISKKLKSNIVESLHPEYGLKENVLYYGLPKRFIAGSVVFGDKDECAEGVKITLTGSKQRRVVNTDNFGDFEFDGLDSNKTYILKVEKRGYESYKVDVKTKNDVYLGEIFLKKVSPKKPSKIKKVKKR